MAAAASVEGFSGDGYRGQNTIQVQRTDILNDSKCFNNIQSDPAYLYIWKDILIIIPGEHRFASEI